MADSMKTIGSWDEFMKEVFMNADQKTALLAQGELFPFELPELDPLWILDEARKHEKVRILRQEAGVESLDLSADFRTEFRAMSIEEAAADPCFNITLFELADLTGPGGPLCQLAEEVFGPYEMLWRNNALIWEGELWPILFMCGTGSATNYHIDGTPNLILHLFGGKEFWSPRDPERWIDQKTKDDYLESGILAVRPPGLGEEHCLVHDNSPGDTVWIPKLVPHWVNGKRSFAGTITFAFRNLRWVENAQCA